MQRAENHCSHAQGQEKVDVPEQAKRNSVLSLFMILFRPPTDWMMLTHMHAVMVFTHLPIQMLISSRNAHTDTQRNNLYHLPWTMLI